MFCFCLFLFVCLFFSDILRLLLLTITQIVNEKEDNNARRKIMTRCVKVLYEFWTNIKSESIAIKIIPPNGLVTYTMYLQECFLGLRKEK